MRYVWVFLAALVTGGLVMSACAPPPAPSVTPVAEPGTNSDLRTALVFGLDFRETATPVVDWKSGKLGKVTGAVFDQAGPGLNRSLQLDGAADYVEFTDAALGSLINMGSGSGSFEIWGKTSTQAQQICLQKSTDGLTARYQMAVVTEGRAPPWPAQAGWSDDAIEIGPAEAVNRADGAWHQFVGVRDNVSGRLNLYVDGKKVVTWLADTLGSTDNTGSLLLGKRAYRRAPDYWNGNLALARIWVGRPLLGTDVAKLYNGGAGLDLRTPVATSMTPNRGARGSAVHVADLVGDHFSGNGKTSFLLRRNHQPDIKSSSCTPTSLTRAGGQITIPSQAAAGSWDLVMVVNGEESAALPDAFTVTP